MRIKDPETQRLIEELRALTGESLTEAITRAVRERIERLRNERSTGLAERLLAISEDCAAHLKEPFRSAEHGQVLYDNQGLPR